MSVEVTLTASNLDTNYCFPGNWNQLLQDMVDKMTGVLAGSVSAYVVSTSVPAAVDRDKGWARLSADGYFERLYFYRNGVWSAKHPIDALSSERRLWVGSAATLVTHDGGSAGVVSYTTGPMWEEDESFQARVPLGVGSLPTLGDVTVQSGTTSTSKVGEDAHQLTRAEIPAHSHPLFGEIIEGSLGLAGENIGDDHKVSFPGNTGDSPEGTSHNNLPPFWGVYFIKRTNRVYYTAS